MIINAILAKDNSVLECVRWHLQEHTRQIQEHTGQRQEHARQIQEHTRQIQEHAGQIQEHTRQIQEHTRQIMSQSNNKLYEEYRNMLIRLWSIIKDVINKKQKSSSSSKFVINGNTVTDNINHC